MQERHSKFVNSLFLALAVVILLIHNGTADIKIKFTLSADDLPDADPAPHVNWPDAFVKLYFAKNDAAKLTLLGRTEYISGTYFPAWPEEFTATIHEKKFPNDEETNEKIRVDVFDYDPDSPNDYHGATSVRLRSLVPNQKRKEANKAVGERRLNPGPGTLCFHVIAITTDAEGYKPADENFCFPIVIYARGITRKHNFHDKKIPVLATSYLIKKPDRLWKKLSSKLQKKILNLVKAPLFERETTSEFLWKNNWESGVAFISLAFSASTLFRFPFACFRFGGGIFFVVYVLIVILVMQPLTFACMIIGRMSKTKLERYPWFYLFSRGIPLVFLYTTLVFITHNNIVLGYSGVYVITQLVETEPDTCTPKMKKYSTCIPYRDIQPNSDTNKGLNGRVLSDTTHLSSDLYFRYYIQGDRWKSGKWFFFSEQEWRFCIGMAFVFLIVLSVVSRNIVTHTARMIMYGACFVPVVLLGMLFFQLYWEGGTFGLIYYFLNIKWRHLVSIEFWVEAWSLAFFSCLPGYGLISSFATYKASARGFYYVSWIICGAAIFFAGLSFALTASELGILEKVSSIKSYYSVMAERTSLSYVVLSNVLMKIPTKWPSVLFFAYISIFGVWTQIVATEVSIGYLIQFCRESVPILKVTVASRVYVALGIIFFEMCMMTGYGSAAGPFMFQAHFLFGGSWIVCVLSFIRIYSATRVYGFDIFLIKVELLLDRSPPKLFRIQVRYILLPVLILGLIPMTVYLFAFNLYNARPKSPMEKPPAGSIIYGWTLNLIPLLLILVYFIRERNRRQVFPMEDAFSERLHGNHGKRHSKKRLGQNTDWLQRRRKAIFWNADSAAETITSADLPLDPADLQEELRSYAIIQSIQKEELNKLRSRKQAQLNWKKSYRNQMVARRRVRTWSAAVNYFVKYRTEEIIRKDFEYLNKLVRNYSVETVFVLAAMEDVEGNGGGLPTEYQLLDKLLLGQGRVHSTVATREPSRFDMIKRLTTVPISQKTITSMYASRMKELLGRPYSTLLKQDDTACTAYVEKSIFEDHEESQDSLTLRSRSFEAKKREPDVIEYSVKYKIGSRKDRILHILVVEGKSHSFLSKLPVPPPVLVHMSLKTVSHLPKKEKFQAITSHTLAHLHKYENIDKWKISPENRGREDPPAPAQHLNSTKTKTTPAAPTTTASTTTTTTRILQLFKNFAADIGIGGNQDPSPGDDGDDGLSDISERNLTKYTDLIAAQKEKRSSGPYEFLHPMKVCIVVLADQHDEALAEFQSHYVQPLDHSASGGWLQKPTRRRDKVNRTIEKIQNILEATKLEQDLAFDLEPGETVKLVTMREQMEERALEDLRDHLEATPSDIVYKGDEDDDDDGELIYKDTSMHQDSDENLKEIIGQDGNPLNLKIHSYHSLDIDADADAGIDVTRYWTNNKIIPHRDRRHSSSDLGSFSGPQQLHHEDPEYSNFQENLKQWKDKKQKQSLPQNKMNDVTKGEQDPKSKLLMKGRHSFVLIADPTSTPPPSPPHKPPPASDKRAPVKSKQVSIEEHHPSSSSQSDSDHRDRLSDQDQHRPSSFHRLYKSKSGKKLTKSPTASLTNQLRKDHEKSSGSGSEELGSKIIKPKKKPEIKHSKQYLDLTQTTSRDPPVDQDDLKHFHYDHDHDHNYHHTSMKELRQKHLLSGRKNEHYNKETNYAYKNRDTGKVLEVKKKKNRFIFANSADSIGSNDRDVHGHGHGS